MAGQLILGLSILVGLHEFGHFAFAKLFKIRVDKFYIFFDFLFPLPNVAKFALVKKKIGDTEYGIGWFPLGGYVQIHGMVDETQDADALAGPPQPDEFRSKPAWQRLLVMLGGIIMNVITGIVIFSALTANYGEQYLPASEARFGILPNGLGREMGFRTGDKIVKINGHPFAEFDDVYKPDVLLGRHSWFTVERQGQLQDINVPLNFMDRMAGQSDSLFVRPREPFSVERVISGSAAAKSGLVAGDVITAVNGRPVQFFDELQAALYAAKGTTAALAVQRQAAPLQVKVSESGRIGFERKPALHFQQRQYSAMQAIPAGTKQAFGVISLQATAIGKIIRRESSASESLGGPIEIAQQYGGQWDWHRFWVMTGGLSMVLAFMNLLPIPALDGGHVVFLLYEMILRRKPSDKFLEGAQRVGTMLILALMAYVILLKPLLKAFHS